MHCQFKHIVVLWSWEEDLILCWFFNFLLALVMGSVPHEIFTMLHVTLVTGCSTTEAYIVLNMEQRAHNSRDNVTYDSGYRIQTMGYTHSA